VVLKAIDFKNDTKIDNNQADTLNKIILNNDFKID